MGNAPCLEHDISQIDDISRFDLMAINGAGCRINQKISWWATYHPEALNKWIAGRERLGGNMNFITISNAINDRYPKMLMQDAPTAMGSSSLFGVFAALRLGYYPTGIVLAGIPLSEDYAHFRRGWEGVKERLAGVKSLSGWTKTFLEGLSPGGK